MREKIYYLRYYICKICEYKWLRASSSESFHHLSIGPTLQVLNMLIGILCDVVHQAEDWHVWNPWNLPTCIAMLKMYMSILVNLPPQKNARCFLWNEATLLAQTAENLFKLLTPPASSMLKSKSLSSALNIEPPNRFLLHRLQFPRWA